MFAAESDPTLAAFSKIAQMGKKALTVLALELGMDHLRFVEMTSGERRVIATGVFPLASGGGRDPEHLAARIRSAVAATRGELRAVIASVPLGDAWLRVLDMPDEVDTESGIRDHVEWDMSRYLGRSRDDVARDLLLDVLGGTEGPSGSRCVIAAAFPRAEALALRATVEKASGLSLKALDVDVGAVVNVFVANYPELSAERTLVIQAHGPATTLIRVRDGAFQGAVVRRDVEPPAGAGGDGDAIRHAADHLQRVRGVVDSLHAMSEEEEDAPSRVFLCGELARDAGFRELLRAHLPVPFGLLNPFRTITGPDPMEHPEAYPGASLAVPVGLAWRLAEDTP